MGGCCASNAKGELKGQAEQSWMCCCCRREESSVEEEEEEEESEKEERDEVEELGLPGERLWLLGPRESDRICSC